MKKRIHLHLVLYLLLAIVLGASLIGCSFGGEGGTSETEGSTSRRPEFPVYHVAVQNGQYYIVLDEPFEYGIEGEEWNMEAYLRYDTLRDLCDTVMNGTLSYGDMYFLMTCLQKDEIGYKICDIEHLYEPALPESGVVDADVIWGGTYYGLDFELEGVNGSFCVWMKEVYEGYSAQAYDEFPQSSITTAITHPITGEQSGITYQYSSHTSRNRLWLRYTLADGERTVEVEKWYEKDATVPYQIRLYCQEDGLYYSFKFRHDGGALPADPSDEALLEFGIKPYVDSEDAKA